MTKIIEEYTRRDGGEVSLMYDEKTDRWEVLSCTAEGDVHWYIEGWREGGRYEGMRLVDFTWHFYTEETARKEFERWRD